MRAGWVCAACGNHYPGTEAPPLSCLICTDERQWVAPSGQRWTTMAELAAAGRHCDIWEEGAVNLSGVRLCEGVPGLGRCRSPVPRSGRCGQADDLVPGGEAVGHLAAVLRCGEAVAAGSEVRRDRAEDREELLSPGG